MALLICHFLIVREDRSSLKAKGCLPPSVDTATSRVGALAVGMCTGVTHGICLFHWKLHLLAGVLKNGFKSLQLHREEHHEFSVSDVQLLIWVFQILVLLCFLLTTFGHRRPHSWPDCLWSRRDMCFGQSTIHP